MFKCKRNVYESCLAYLKRRLPVFLQNQSGAVTVDWVVLTAAIVGLGVAVMSSVGQTTASVGEDKIARCMTILKKQLNKPEKEGLGFRRLGRAHSNCGTLK